MPTKLTRSNVNRDISLDWLRVLGILVIIIAHANPPLLLAQLRNFGTPLLIVVSGLTHAYIYSSRELAPGVYLRRRLPRLIMPAWFFFVFFFGAFLAADIVLDKEFPFALNEVVNTFTFYGGIGYVWIFKVYIVLALMTPAALKLAKGLLPSACYFFILAVALAAHELLLPIGRAAIRPEWLEFFDTVIFVLVPYAVLYLYGMRMHTMSRRAILVAAVVGLLVFAYLATVGYAETGTFVPTQTDKYPPGLYYLSYAFMASNLVYLACRGFDPASTTLRRFVVWLSSSALWIYLWHILGIFVWSYALGEPSPHYGTTLLMTSFLVAFGILATIVQQRFVRRFWQSSRYPALRYASRWLV